MPSRTLFHWGLLFILAGLGLALYGQFGYQPPPRRSVTLLCAEVSQRLEPKQMDASLRKLQAGLAELDPQAKLCPQTRASLAELVNLVATNALQGRPEPDDHVRQVAQDLIRNCATEEMLVYQAADRQQGLWLFLLAGGLSVLAGGVCVQTSRRLQSLSQRLFAFRPDFASLPLEQQIGKLFSLVDSYGELKNRKAAGELKLEEERNLARAEVAALRQELEALRTAPPPVLPPPSVPPPVAPPPGNGPKGSYPAPVPGPQQESRSSQVEFIYDTQMKTTSPYQVPDPPKEETSAETLVPQQVMEALLSSPTNDNFSLPLAALNDLQQRVAGGGALIRIAFEQQPLTYTHGPNVVDVVARTIIKVLLQNNSLLPDIGLADGQVFWYLENLDRFERKKEKVLRQFRAQLINFKRESVTVAQMDLEFTVLKQVGCTPATNGTTAPLTFQPLGNR